MPPLYPSIPMCSCKDRYHAMANGDFTYNKWFDAWIFPHGPYREMSYRAKSNAVVRGIEDRSGEPFTFDVCPWCGKDLPRSVKPETKWIDGEDGG